MAAALLSILSITSCTKQQQGDYVLWYDEATAQSLVDDDSFTLTYIVDGETQATMDSDLYYTSEPQCGVGGINITMEWEDSETKTVSYIVKDQVDDIIFSGNLTFQANKCLKLKLE